MAQEDPYSAYRAPAQQAPAANPYGAYQTAAPPQSQPSGNFMDDFLGKNSNDLLPADAPGAAFFNRLGRTAKGIVSTIATPPESAGDYASFLAGPGGLVMKRLASGQIDAEKQLAPQLVDQAKGAIASHETQPSDSIMQQIFKRGPSLEDARVATTGLSMLNPFASASVANVNSLQDLGKSNQALQEGIADILPLAASLKGRFSSMNKPNVLQMKPQAPSVWNGPTPPGYPEAPALSATPIADALAEKGVTQPQTSNSYQVIPRPDDGGAPLNFQKNGQPGGFKTVDLHLNGEKVGAADVGGNAYAPGGEGGMEVKNIKIDDPSLQGQGHGKMFYEQLAQHAKDQGATHMMSDVSRKPGAEGAWQGLAEKYPDKVKFSPDTGRYHWDLRDSQSQTLSGTPIEDAITNNTPRHVSPGPAQFKRWLAQKAAQQGSK